MCADNEAFWSLTRLSNLQTTRATGGNRLLAEATRRRYELLLDADWSDFFTSIRKSHREYRFWWCLLAANRRIFLLHAASFGILLCLQMHAFTHFDLNGWGGLFFAPLVMLLPFISAAYGKFFAMMANMTVRTRSVFEGVMFVFAIALALCIGLMVMQANLPFDRFAGSGIVTVDGARISPLVIVVCFGARSAPPPGHATHQGSSSVP